MIEGLNYVSRCKYGYNHEKSHEVYDRIHISIYDTTLCGINLDSKWYVHSQYLVRKEDVNCKKCLAKLEKIRNG